MEEPVHCGQGHSSGPEVCGESTGSASGQACIYFSVPDCGWDVTTCIGSCCLAFPTAMESEPGPGAEINPPSPYVALSFITARETKPGH